MPEEQQAIGNESSALPNTFEGMLQRNWIIPLLMNDSPINIPSIACWVITAYSSYIKLSETMLSKDGGLQMQLCVEILAAVLKAT